MRRVTLIPAPAMLAILALLIGAEKIGGLESFRVVGIMLFLALPILALCEFAGFAYDLQRRKEEILSRSFAPRMATHVVGSGVGIWVFILIINLPGLHLG